jgi:hypothetical protein
MTKLPSFDTYGPYTGNYSAHALVFTDADGNRFWFSYKTLVAFDGRHGRVVIKNYWKQTTGKHLNAIDGGCKRDRVDQETFDRLFREAYGRKARAA